MFACPPIAGKSGHARGSGLGQFSKLLAERLPDHRYRLFLGPEWGATVDEDGHYSLAVAL